MPSQLQLLRLTARRRPPYVPTFDLEALALGSRSLTNVTPFLPTLRLLSDFAPFLRSSPSLPPVPVPAFLPGSGPSEETIESTADILRLADLRARYAVLKSQRITCESDRQATTPPAVVIVSSPEVAPPSSTTPLGSPPST